MSLQNCRDNRGITAMEAVVAILILSFAGILAARTLLSTSHSVVQLRHMTKGSSLADMVFEQYASYAAYNYYTLSMFNVTNQSPKDFFKASDNLGYDGM